MADIKQYKFGQFRVDLVYRMLLKGDERVPLPAKSFEVLALLIEHRERAVSREELMGRIWSGLSVTDNNFNVTLSTVRRALGESARNNKYILTTPEGYRFTAPVTESTSDEPGQAALETAAPEVDAPELQKDLPSKNHEPSAESQFLVQDQRAKTKRRVRLVGAAIAAILLLGTILLITTLYKGKKSGNSVYSAATPREEGKVIRLTDHLANDIYPSWSSDGKHIAFISTRERMASWGDLWMVNDDGTNPHRLTKVPDSPNGVEDRPVWLGNTGDIILLEAVNYHEFLRFHLSARPVLPVTRKVEDSDSPFFTQMLVVPGRRGAHFFTVTRDGTRAAWVAMPKIWYTCPTVGVVRTSLVSDLVHGDAIEAGAMVVSSWFECNIQPGESPIKGISFSPDGSQIVVAKNPAPEVFGFDLEIYNLDGTLIRRLTDNGAGNSPIINWNPVWSSDNRIAFASNRTGRFEIYTINPDGSDLRQVTSKGGDFPDWSPDGKKIAFQSERDGNKEIYTIAVK